jgi:hypothetical protein
MEEVVVYRNIVNYALKPCVSGFFIARLLLKRLLAFKALLCVFLYNSGLTLGGVLFGERILPRRLG